MIHVGQYVKFEGGDSRYEGWVVAIFEKRGGAFRCVVEDDRGLLLIKNPHQAIPAVRNQQ